MSDNLIPRHYFAAANSFDGFISDFDEIFAPERHKRLYIIKGGPGTGKNTFMRKVAEALERGGLAVDRIYCSSDPRSLDGIIIYGQSGSVAMIDGTSPHTKDPKYPGSLDTIINLGEAFDERALYASLTEIMDLCNKKAAAYRRAYSLLHYAGVVFDSINTVLSNCDNYIKAEAGIVNSTLSSHSGSFGIRSAPLKRYLCAFGARGKYGLPIGSPSDGTVIKGDGVIEYRIMSSLKASLSNASNLKIYSPSPFSPKLTDHLLTEDKWIYIDEGSSSPDIDLSSTEFELPDEYADLHSAYISLLKMSERNFKQASDEHFALERIYSANMDFSYNDKKRAEVIDEIDFYLTK